MAILNQLSMQIGGDENVELNANGSNTKMDILFILLV
mgnify:CR=1 FL=1